MSHTPLLTDLLRKKRDGESLQPDEIRHFIAGVADDTIPDYQVGAMLMAVFLRGLDDGELGVWADAMVHSGDVLDLSGIDRPKVDKHSTGGVGDKISLCLAPAVAACGVAVPMISGRGLGHSGGTLDKLEAIPGFRVDLPSDRFIELVDQLGLCLIGQTARLAPADRRLYALRDVTATVESIPLIASSIMSKKLAEGIDALVLDCKVGRGAFMKTVEQARALGEAIRVIGRAAGKRVSVLLTEMDAPIGQAVGNATEVAEAIAVLRGGGPADTRELTVRLGAEMLVLAGVVEQQTEGATRIEAALDGGAGLALFGRVVEAQGGDPRVIDDPDAVLPQAPERLDITASVAGVVTAVDALAVGHAGLALGAGRARKEDQIDHAAGIDILARVGDRVEVGQVVARLRHRGRGADDAADQVRDAFTIATGEQPARAPGSRIIEELR
ncbi:thymidine phosphorylase [Haliangium sp.]|uniref:thymidine phosphorylase n=1 Tax=Haliangium sp. TaxID=2663208 RepID=UPI003D141A8F